MTEADLHTVTPGTILRKIKTKQLLVAVAKGSTMEPLTQITLDKLSAAYQEYEIYVRTV